MATDVERLVVLLEANSENLRRNMRGAERVVDTSARRMERRLRSLQRAFFAVGAVLAGGGLLGQTVRLADAYRSLDNRLRLVTDTEEERAALLRQLADLSAETRTSLEGTTTVYFRLTRGLERFGVQGQRLIDIVRTINQTVAISGSTAQEAEGALIQFSQALNTDFQSAGQEIRSLQEGMPGLVSAIEDGMGIARGSFAQMARDGEISTMQVIEALERIANTVQTQFGQTNSTTNQAIQAFTDSLTIAVGQLNEGARATDRLALALQNASETIRSNESGWRMLGEVMGLIVRAAELGAPTLPLPRFGGRGDQPIVGGMLGDWLRRGQGQGGSGPGFINGQSNGTSTRMVPGFGSVVGPSVGPQMVDEAERYEEALRRQEEASQALKDLANERLVIANKLAEVADAIAEKEREAQEQIQQNLQRTVDGFLSAIENAESLEDALKRVVIQMLRMALMSEGGGGFLQTAFSAAANAFLGGGSIKPGKAVGGYVAGGKSYMVGERGPELFTPRMGGNITPNGARSGSSGPVNINIDARGAQRGVAEEIQAAVPGLLRLVDARIRDNASRGGAFAGSIGRA